MGNGDLRISAPDFEDDLTYVEPDQSDPLPKRGSAMIIQNKQYTGQRLAVVDGQIRPCSKNDQTVQWSLSNERDGFCLVQCNAPGGPYNLRLGSRCLLIVCMLSCLAVAQFGVRRDGEDYSLTADSRDTKDHRWKLMTGKDGYFSLVNNSQCLHRYSAHSMLPVCVVHRLHEVWHACQAAHERRKQTFCRKSTLFTLWR